MKKNIFFSKIGIIGLFIFLLSSADCIAQGQTPEPRFRTYHTGQAFTAITVDLNKNVWAGTDRQGIYFLSQAVSTPQPTFSAQTIGTAPVVGTLRINSLATDKTGSIWVAHSGSSGTFNGGGVEKINVSSLASQHFISARDARGFSAQGLPYLERDGTATLNAQQVIVDKNNTVWIAQRYHDLLSSPNYFVTPGTFSFRNAEATTPFNSVSTWKDHQDGTMDSNIPYPAYTYNPTASQTGQTRNFTIISADKEFMWTGHYGYEVHQEVPQVPPVPGEYIQARLMKCTLSGQTTGEFYTTKQAKLGSGGVFNGVYANNKKGTWATKSIAGVGFSVLKDGKWYNVNDPQIVPAGAKFNDKAIWGDVFGKVYLGTDKGLIVYDGIGPVNLADSYTLYTNIPYTSNRNVTDPDMLSNNITAGSIEGDLSPYFSWIATPSGIMRLFLPPGDVKVMHVEYKNFPFNQIEPLNGKENYIPFADLKRQTATYVPSENEAPIFAADGTQSSVFRIKTTDGVGFYASSNNYKYEIVYDNFSTVPGTPGTELYKAKYGEFTLKPIADYGNGATPETLTEVDVIFRHPEFIDANEFVANKNYAKFRLVIWDKRDPLNPVMIFDHPIKFSLPPVLLVHGVWTEMSSLKGIEESLKTKGYTDSEILKAWRTDVTEAESPFEGSALVIPNAINTLRANALGAKVSAGKVNLVVHSRGGLYARAYIENISYQTYYKDDINSLITLNTPHFGSQAANAVLDKRIAVNGFRIISGIATYVPLTFTYSQIIPQMTVGDLVKKTGVVPEKDQILDWGAKVLSVENDNLSHKNEEETKFIANLNSPSNVQKLQGVPIHAVATNFSICEIHPILCNPLGTIPVLAISSPWIKSMYLLWDSLVNQLPSSLDQFITHLYDGETSDAVVPNRSMKAGLSSQYISTFPGENILHISGIDGVGSASGVTTTPSVHNRIFELLKQDFKSTNSNFTRDGIIPTPLRYNFLPNLSNGYSNKSTTTFNGGFAIDPNSFTGDMLSGGTISYNVLQVNVNKLNVVYDCLGTNMTFLTNRIGPLPESNNFVFTIPQNFVGSLKITVYGYDITGAIIGENTYTITVLSPAGATLQSIRYENPDITIPEQTLSEFKLLGMYSDGIERRINDIPGITYVIDNPTIIQKTDNKTVKGLALGETALVATVGALTTSLNVFVIVNPALLQSLVTSYYSEYTGLGPVSVKWDVYQQYRAQKFILERSSDNVAFAPLNEQLAAGTNYTPMNYSYIDNTTDELIYYRLKLIDLDNVVTYSNVIEVRRGTLANTNFAINDNKIVLTPNPLLEGTGGLLINSSIVDSNADLNIYNISGRLIFSKKCELKGGIQTISFNMPIGASKGLYLVQIKTKEFTKTLKLLYQK
ncbi:T9SS type A sorting domain-containing protein [Flavobacterium sp.]|uniref:T9SS type A sorting domain-containing protein n=1 Tax=Flavobacterium sp. TaxID=239 RepID=UPI0038FD1E92